MGKKEEDNRNEHECQHVLTRKPNFTCQSLQKQICQLLKPNPR